MISFDFPTENSKVASSSGRGAGHKYYSGKFLITSLRHKITQDEYTMHVEAIKDGYKSAISSGFEATDPVVQIPNPVTGLSAAEFGTWEGKDSDAALAVSGRLKGQSGR